MADWPRALLEFVEPGTAQLFAPYPMPLAELLDGSRGVENVLTIGFLRYRGNEWRLHITAHPRSPHAPLEYRRGELREMATALSSCKSERLQRAADLLRREPSPHIGWAEVEGAVEHEADGDRPPIYLMARRVVPVSPGELNNLREQHAVMREDMHALAKAGVSVYNITKR